MSDNIEIHNTENKNEWVNWIEEAVDKNQLKYYEYNEFNNFQEIGTGGFGKVLDNITVKEIVREIRIQREVDYHDNIIRCHGITKFKSENQHSSSNYMLVMEYADSGCLRDYLKKKFNKLTWDDKYLMAYQLTCAVSCLHNEGIVHRDLHSGNILVHQNMIKLADFGLSKRIGASSNFQSKLFGMVPYVDPKSFGRRRNNNNQIYSLNEKSDVYSIGVLLWELSSGQPPFYAEGEHYDVGLIFDISQGLRETVVPDTPDEYVKIYTKCWDGEPDNRPTINQVVDWLKALITKTDIITENLQLSNDQKLNEVLNEDPLSTNNLESQGDLSQLIQNFDKMDTKEIDTVIESSKEEEILIEKDFSIIVDEINDLIFKLLNKGIGWQLIEDQVIDHFNNHNIKLQEIYNWLLNNQNNLNSIFLLGYIYYIGIEINADFTKAFNLFLNASGKNHTLAQYFVGDCYQYGNGTIKNEKLAFKYYEKAANKNLTHGQLQIGYFYEIGFGIKKDLKKAFYWYEKAANNGNLKAMHDLSDCYRDGIGVKKNYNKAFELAKQSAEGGHLNGINKLGCCYERGIGTNIDNQKACELFQKSADLGNKFAQYNLALMYENGKGITKDIDKAIYWYEKSAKQGHQNAQKRYFALKL
ncbi:kinase-like domain-containing protein [Rhizophagus clarus]|uniref:Kinase-like domain-containing protein n=1 Tax=Rhizophagus clarus TaxID=94130 RepID=A0A8H3R5W7_9GLOM|nr:kinase-like domain-containing protein [Rhizophagus clarus]